MRVVVVLELVDVVVLDVVSGSVEAGKSTVVVVVVGKGGNVVVVVERWGSVVEVVGGRSIRQTAGPCLRHRRIHARLQAW
jgi:hypothetical protein